MEYYLTEGISWIAYFLFLFAYFLVSTNRLEGDGIPYNLMNLSGALLYGTYASLGSAHPVLILEFFWGSIAIVALCKIIFERLSNKFEYW